MLNLSGSVGLIAPDNVEDEDHQSLVLDVMQDTPVPNSDSVEVVKLPANELLRPARAEVGSQATYCLVDLSQEWLVIPQAAKRPVRMA
jgi:hypothetical protein